MPDIRWGARVTVGESDEACTLDISIRHHRVTRTSQRVQTGRLLHQEM